MTDEFDFTNAINVAQGVVNSAEGGEKQYPYPLIYPQQGQTITVKLLFNPKSGLITKKVTRHDKVACYRTYGMDCPICSLMQQVIDTTGKDPFGKSKAKTRAVSFATFIKSTKPIESNNRKVNPGDTILLMYPWSVYTEINQSIAAISKIPSSIERAFKSPIEGLFIQISVSDDFKYSTTVVPYMTYDTGLTEEQYLKMLSEMPSLAEQILPSTITQEVDKQVQEYAANIYNTYISPKVPNQNVTEGNTPTSVDQAFQNRQQIAAAQTPMASPQQIQGSHYVPPVNPTNPLINQAAQTSNGKPSCFGEYKDNSPKCICCPHEVDCVAATAAKDPEIPFE